MKKVAVLYIATGKYVRLWPGFLESAEKYLLKSCEVEYFVFTDVDHLAEEEDNPRIHRIFQEPMPWPYTTLLRFEIFLKAEEQLKAFDYIYFFNARRSMNIWYLCCTRHFTGGITMSLPMTTIHAARRTFRWDWGVITSAAASTVVTGTPI